MAKKKTVKKSKKPETVRIRRGAAGILTVDACDLEAFQKLGYKVVKDEKKKK